MIKMVLDIPPSVNHCYVNIAGQRKGRKLTEAAKNWKLLAGYEANQAKRKQGWIYPDKDEKIVLLLWAFWPDRRPRDMNNCHKLLPDALENVLFENDKNVLVRDIDFSFDAKRPRLEIVVARKDEVDVNETQY